MEGDAKFSSSRRHSGKLRAVAVCLLDVQFVVVHRRHVDLFYVRAQGRGDQVKSLADGSNGLLHLDSIVGYASFVLEVLGYTRSGLNI